MEYALRVLSEVGRSISKALVCTDQKRKEELLQKLVDKINLVVETYGENTVLSKRLKRTRTRIAKSK